MENYGIDAEKMIGKLWKIWKIWKRCQELMQENMGNLWKNNMEKKSTKIMEKNVENSAKKIWRIVKKMENYGK